MSFLVRVVEELSGECLEELLGGGVQELPGEVLCELLGEGLGRFEPSRGGCGWLLGLDETDSPPVLGPGGRDY